MMIRELVKNEIDMLPNDAIYAVHDFVLSQKKRIATDRTPTRSKSIQWLEEPWKINDFKPLAREDIYDRI